MTDARGQLVLDFTQGYRKTSVSTSIAADSKMTKSGKKKRHCEIIYQCLKKHNGSTTKELADYLASVLEYQQIWRRMHDLEDNGLARKNEKIKRDGCSTWWTGD